MSPGNPEGLVKANEAARKSRFLTVSFEGLDRKEFFAALVARDEGYAAKLLDEAIEFGGLAGKVLEHFDGVIIDGIIDLVQSAIKYGFASAKTRA